jgi:hypothetical protein
MRLLPDDAPPSEKCCKVPNECPFSVYSSLSREERHRWQRRLRILPLAVTETTAPVSGNCKGRLPRSLTRFSDTPRLPAPCKESGLYVIRLSEVHSRCPAVSRIRVNVADPELLRSRKLIGRLMKSSRRRYHWGCLFLRDTGWMLNTAGAPC